MLFEVLFRSLFLCREFILPSREALGKLAMPSRLAHTAKGKRAIFANGQTLTRRRKFVSTGNRVSARLLFIRMYGFIIFRLVRLFLLL
jgi:hypothetical protein